jgi:hypothetical protein
LVRNTSRRPAMSESRTSCKSSAIANSPTPTRPRPQSCPGTTSGPCRRA